MLELTWAKLNERNFVSAIMALSNDNKLDRITSYRVGRILEMARRELQKAGAIEIKRAEELAEKDEKGNIIKVPVPMGERPKLSPENEKKLDEEMKKVFEEHKVEIKVSPLDFNSLSGLNGEQYLAIEEICVNLPKE